MSSSSGVLAPAPLLFPTPCRTPLFTPLPHFTFLCRPSVFIRHPKQAIKRPFTTTTEPQLKLSNRPKIKTSGSSSSKTLRNNKNVSILKNKKASSQAQHQHQHPPSNPHPPQENEKMSLFNNRALTLLTLLLALLFLSISTTTAAPTPADTAASTFIVNIYSSRGDCNSHYLTDVGEGPYVKGGGACFQYGGNAFWLTQSGGCKAQSWSGNNCRGSSSKLTNDGFCHPVPFGSILVVC